MLKKICIILTILLLTISVAAAYEFPNGFHKNSDQYYSNGDYGITIGDYKPSDAEWCFNNDTDYIVVEGNDHIWTYTDKLTKQVGVLEVIDGNMVVEVYVNGSDVGQCREYLLEFNRLNNVKPLELPK